jgi:predicted GNAT family N-acyltransferase
MSGDLIEREPYKVQITVQDHLTEEMDQLRLQCFPPTSQQLTSRDAWDERSKHITVVIDGQIAAYLRLTPGPNAVLENWTQGRAQIPTGKEVIDAGRALVAPAYRGHQIYEAVVLKAFQWAEENDFKYVVGAYKHGRHLGSRILRLGFKNIGNPVYTDEPDGNRFLIQPVVFKVKPHHYNWTNLIKHCLEGPTEKLWKNLIHLEISRLEHEEFVNNQALIQELKEITAPSYEDPTAMIKRDLSHCNKLYLGHNPDGKLVTFFMVGWEPILFKGKYIPSVFLGLSATCQDCKNSGIVRTLYQRFVLDAQAWEEAHQQRLLLWYTTATPAVFHATNIIFSENEPYINGHYTNEGADYAIAIRHHMKWPAFEGEHPFVVKGIAKNTRYSALERARIEHIVKTKNFTLFAELGIDETQGDRMVRIGRIPFKKSAAKL